MSGIRSLPMIKLLTGLLLLAWPFVIWFGLAHNGLHWLLPLMALLLSGDNPVARRGLYKPSRNSSLSWASHYVSPALC